MFILIKPLIFLLSDSTRPYRFMTRPDVKQKHLGCFLDWSLTSISQSSGDSVIEIRKLDGVLQSLVKSAPVIQSSCPCVGWGFEDGVYVLRFIQPVIYKS